MGKRRKIKLYQLMGILRDGVARFSIEVEDGHVYCEEYGRGLGALQNEPWYEGIKDYTVTRIVTIGGYCDYPVETRIRLEGKAPVGADSIGGMCGKGMTKG